MSGRVLLLGFTLGWAVANASPAAAAQVPCSDLAKLSLPEATVTAAEEVPAGEYAPPAGPRLGNLPAFCRLALKRPRRFARPGTGPPRLPDSVLWFGLERGTPLTGLAGNNAFPIASTYFQHWIRQNPQFDWHTLSEADFASDFLASQRKFHDVIGTDDPNLERFRKHGGKMIIWHGEADPLIFPRGTVNYFDRVLAANGGAQEVKQFARLFLAPGVGHCGGGEGPNPVGVFDALVNWVEKGVAPDTVPATRRRQDGTVVARPLCAYPETARWMGNGSPDDAANFVCVDGQHRSGDFRVADPPRN
jgi:tannase/feruloyl esterase